MNMNELSERLFKTLSYPSFLAMKGLANEVPIFIQTYAASLRTKCNLPYIATESDLDQWLAALRTAAQRWSWKKVTASASNLFNFMKIDKIEL